MSQPARVSTDPRAMPERDASRSSKFVSRVGILHAGDKSSFCVIRSVSAASAQINLFSDILEGEPVSLRAGDSQAVTGTVSRCKNGVARIELDDPQGAQVLKGFDARNDPDRRRSLPRVNAAARVRVKANGRTTEARLLNISTTGARISAGRTLAPRVPALLTLPDFGDLHGFVCWANATEAGLRFNVPLPVDALATWLRSRIRVSY